MMMTDPIADMLTRIRNANIAMHDDVRMPSSKLKEALAEDPPAGGLHRRASTSRRRGRPGRCSRSHEVLARPRAHDLRPQRDVQAGLASTAGRQRAPRARRPRRRRPVDQPGAHDRPRGAPAQRRRRGPLLRVVTERMMSRSASTHHGPERRRRHHRRAAHVTVRAPRATLSTTIPGDITIVADGDDARRRAARRRARQPGAARPHPHRWSPTWSTASPRASRKELEIVGVGYRAEPQGQRRSSWPSASATRSWSRPPTASRSRCPPRPASSCAASTSSWSARWPPTSARSASPSRTRARASATRRARPRKAGKAGEVGRLT